MKHKNLVEIYEEVQEVVTLKLILKEQKDPIAVAKRDSRQRGYLEQRPWGRRWV